MLHMWEPNTGIYLGYIHCRDANEIVDVCINRGLIICAYLRKIVIFDASSRSFCCNLMLGLASTRLNITKMKVTKDCILVGNSGGLTLFDFSRIVEKKVEKQLLIKKPRLTMYLM